MKSVRTRIMLTMCTLVVVSLLIVSVMSVYLNIRTTNGSLEQTMQEMASIASRQVSNHLRVYKVIVETAARDERLYSRSASLEDKQAVIDELVYSYHDLTRGNVLGADGNSVFTGDNFSDREYFKKAMQGQVWVSEPVVSKVTGAITIIIAAPIWQDNIAGSTVAGVLYLVPTETFLNDIVSKIKISSGAGSQIINKQGTVIAHPNMDFVSGESNAQENEKTNPAMKPIAALEREMMAGRTGFGTYSMLGVKKFLAYAPIEDSDGWSIGVNAPTSDFMSYTNMSILVTSVLSVVAIIVALFTSISLANGIGKPLRVLTDILSSIAQTGRVNIGESATRQEQAYGRRKDEIGALARSASDLIEMLEAKVDSLNFIADGDLTKDVVCRSADDAIGNALIRMVGNLNEMFSEINAAAVQVSTGASQIADGSQALAQGSVEQSASVEQLSSSISEVADKTAHNADMAKEAADLSNTVKQNAQKGSSQMENMMQAVKDINEASNSIGKVIKAIDDIAFQTNILALNAAVEAARAGQHGKGFAVVADEVRSLAAKSAEAAKDTSGLISASIEKSQLGYQIATETSVSLQEIVGGIDRSTEIVTQIAASSKEQTDSIMQINKGIDQVAQVVQQNSATSQQSAAASEEMSGQASLLRQLIARFKIKSGGRDESLHSMVDSRFSDKSGFAIGGSEFDDKF